MPCDSSYLEPTKLEVETKQAAILTKYVCNEMGWTIPEYTMAALNNNYPRDPRIIPDLCRMVGELKDDERERIVYDGHNARARDLADWWEEHQQADQVREERLAAHNHKTELIRSGLSKLTKEERAAIFGFAE